MLLKSRLQQISNRSALILTGDFNSTELQEPYQELMSEFKDSYREVHPQRRPDEASYHGFIGSTQGVRIDWILHSTQLIPVAAEILRTHGPDGRWPSDHYPVTAVFHWAKT
jgi:endonuclease/exonuclease/phosphatase family metal-dependent hydrolase